MLSLASFQSLTFFFLTSSFTRFTIESSKQIINDLIDRNDNLLLRIQGLESERDQLVTQAAELSLWINQIPVFLNNYEFITRPNHSVQKLFLEWFVKSDFQFEDLSEEYLPIDPPLPGGPLFKSTSSHKKPKMSHPIPVGNLEFSGVNFNYEEIAVALREFVLRGSARHEITADDLTIIARQEKDAKPFTTVAEAINAGTRLFDALAYFSLPTGQRPTVQHEELPGGTHDPTIKDISRGVFYIFMWILIRGTAPSDDPANNTEPRPNFLVSVMGLGKPPHEYVQAVASFNLKHISPQWVKYIKLTELGQEAQNRLALGIAGYRLPAALSIMDWKENLTDEQRRPAEAVRRFVGKGPMWDCFSGTRTGAFLAAVKNLNKNLENLILDVVDEDIIQQFVTAKALPVHPVRRPNHVQYRSWTDDTFAEFKDRIFPESS